MKKISFANAILVIAVILFASCKGDQGPVGPAGLAGPTGATGATGSQGPVGSANVIYSSWFGPSFNGGSAWIGSTFAGVQTNYINYASASLTQALIDQGVILVYANLGGYANLGYNSITQLPFTHMSAGNQVETWSHNMAAGNVRVNFQTTIGWTPAQMSTTYRFRYIFIPGAVAGRISSGPAAGYTIDQLKTMSYQQVLSLLSIPENGSNHK